MNIPSFAPIPRHITWIDHIYEMDSSCLWLEESLRARLANLLPSLLTHDARVVDQRRDANIRVAIKPSLGLAESYRLSVRSTGINIVGADPAGAFYGLITLSQWMRQQPNQLQCCDIDDQPDFPVRGVMLDVSRCKVPKLSTLFQLMDKFASWKINQVQLYMEHTFAYSGHEVIWRDASPYTADDMLHLDDYCRERFIELVPNQNSFGHLHRWFKHPDYRDLAEHEGTFPTPWGEQRCGPSTLNPTSADSIPFLEELYDELLPCFESRLVNVGCDETFDIGYGKSRDRCDAIGKGRVYLEFLLKIHASLLARGHSMLFWGDIVLHYPELVPELPTDVTPLVWGYEEDHPFAEECSRFAESGLNFYVCPGTSSWLSIAGRTDNCLGNLRSAAKAGLASGAKGYLITDWGDQGHWQHLPVSYTGMLAGASFAWCLETNRDMDIANALDQHAFSDRRGELGNIALDLGNLYQLVEPILPNKSQLWRLLLLSPEQIANENYKLSDLVKASERVRHIIDRLEQTEITSSDGQLVSREWINTAQFLLQGCMRGIAHVKQNKKELVNFVGKELCHCVREHRELWMARNREGGYEESVTPLLALLRE